MVLLAAAICSRDGKALVSRQFVEMPKSRIEGLIGSFPKLANRGKQHTFVETDSVRYVYQPLERMYVLLITTKASNILEDLETLRLFARVIPEYARGSETSDIIENAFQIIFAFDEIVALGYRECVTLSQIRTFTEMDSHEEKMYNAVRENQMQEARELSKRKARELQQARVAAAKQGLPLSSIYNKIETYEPRQRTEPSTDEYSSPLLGSPNSVIEPPIRRGMKLGGRTDNAISEIEKLVDTIPLEKPSVSTIASQIKYTKPGIVTVENLHIGIEEKMSLKAGRDGGLVSMEVDGVLQVCANTEEASLARVCVDLSEATVGTNKRPPVSLQTHPNIDKDVFRTTNWLQVKPGGKTFPVKSKVGVLKWRLKPQESLTMPVFVNCWPNPVAGGFEVNTEFELQDTSLSLHNFRITIPLPSCTQAPIIGSCDGDYSVDMRRGEIIWSLPLIDADYNTGALDFVVKTAPGIKADLFFPVQLTFTSPASYCGVKVVEATNTDGSPIPFSCEVDFHTDLYEFN